MIKLFYKEAQSLSVGKHIVTMKNMEDQEPKERWKMAYTIVLIANAVYIMLFYFLTQVF